MIFSWTPPLVCSIATFDDRGVCDFIPSMISGTELIYLLAEPLAGPAAAIYVQKRETYPLYSSRNLWIVDICLFVTSQFSRCISWLSQLYNSTVFSCFPGEIAAVKNAFSSWGVPPWRRDRRRAVAADVFFSSMRLRLCFVWWLPSGK